MVRVRSGGRGVPAPGDVILAAVLALVSVGVAAAVDPVASVAGLPLIPGREAADSPLSLTLVALACEVCFSMLALPLLPRLGAVRVAAYACVLAVPLLTAIGLAVDGGGLLRAPTAAEALGLGYLSIVITVVAFLLWYTGLPRLGPQRAGLFAGLIPVGALVTTVVLGLGVPGPADLGGAALVIAGILLGLRGGGRNL